VVRRSKDAGEGAEGRGGEGGADECLQRPLHHRLAEWRGAEAEHGGEKELRIVVVAAAAATAAAAAALSAAERGAGAHRGQAPRTRLEEGTCTRPTTGRFCESKKRRKPGVPTNQEA